MDDDIFYCFWLVFKGQNLCAGQLVSCTTFRRNQLLNISWSLPTEGWIKINSDGSVDQHSRASCGGLLRNSLGHVAANLGICPISTAEVWGVFYSLQLAG